MRIFALAALVLGGVTGCSVTVDDTDVSAERRSDALQQDGALRADVRAEVAVERAISADGSVRSHVSARFVTVTGAIDQDAARNLLGAARFPDADEADSCSRMVTANALPALGDGAIELLDVGDIVLRAEGTVVPLAARAFPDVGELISGVVYTSRGVHQPLPDGVIYWVEAAGASEAGGAVQGLPSLSVQAPAALAEVRLRQERLDALGLGPQMLGPSLAPQSAQAQSLQAQSSPASGQPSLAGQNSGSQAADSQNAALQGPDGAGSPGNAGAQGARDELIIVEAGEAMQFSWQAGNRAAGDFIVVEIAEVVPDGTAVQCIFADDGSAEVPGRYITFAAGKDLDVVVRRVRKISPVMDAAAAGEMLLGDVTVWFDFSLSARAAVQ